MVDVNGLLKQGWMWIQSQKHVLLSKYSKEKLIFVVDQNWPMINFWCSSFGRFVLMLLLHWRDCAINGFWSLIGLGSMSLFVIMWSCFVSFSSISCVLYTLLGLGAAGATIHLLGSSPGLFIVGSFGILIMWIFGSVWITGMLLIVGGYVISLHHARVLIVFATVYAIYFVNVRAGLLGVFLAFNLAFFSSNLLTKLHQGYDGVSESTNFEEQKESEPLIDDFSENCEYFSMESEAEKASPTKSSPCKTPTTPTILNIQKEAPFGKVPKAEPLSVDEMKRIIDSSNHYEAFGLPRYRSVDPLMLKKEYRRMAVLVHPDKNMGNPLASESFKKLQGAYETLSDFTKKKSYDDQLKKEESRRIFQNSRGASQQVEIPRAFVCAESKIFDVSEWPICQGMSCKPNTHKPSFHVNMKTVQRSNYGSRYPWSLDAEMNPEDDEFEIWFQQALASGLFSESPRRRKSWSPFKISTPKGIKSWRRSP